MADFPPLREPFGGFASEPGDFEHDDEIDDFEFEEPTEEELDEIEGWFEDQLPEDLPDELPEPEAEEPRQEKKALVVKHEGKPAGFAHVHKKGAKAHVSVAVRPDLRRHGLGRHLLHKVEQMPGLKVYDFRVWVHKDNKAARKLLEKEHYKPHRRQGDFIEYRKRIVEGATGGH